VLGVFTGRPTCNALALVAKEVRLLGSMTYGRAGARADFDVALDLLRTHIDLAQTLITHRFALDAVQTAFDTAADKRSGAVKVTVLP
jgi:threonine dehydrogenase-like Zn-dependent dehydrogenase